MNRPRVLYVVHGFPPEQSSGTELNSSWLAYELSKKFEIFVFTRTDDSSLAECETRDEGAGGVKIRRVKVSAKYWIDPSDQYLNGKIDELFETYLDEVRPALVHVHHTIGLSAGVIEVVKSRGVPLILHVRDFFYMCERVQLLDANRRLCEGPEDGGKCANCIKANSMPHIPVQFANIYSSTFEQAGIDRTEYMRQLIRLPDIIVCPSQFAKEKFLEFGVPSRKIIISPDGIKLKALPKRKKQFRENRIVFGLLGNLAYHKGLHILNDAFKELDQSKAELRIYGRDENPTLAKEYRASSVGLNVKFLGPYLNNELRNILSQIDVLVQPSICHESYSIVIREAFAAGLPVIVSNIRAQMDAVRDGSNGLHFQAGNSSDLARKMNRFLEEPDLLRQLKRNIPKVTAVEDQANQFATLYKKLIDDRKPRTTEKRLLEDVIKIRERIDSRNREQMLRLIQSAQHAIDPTNANDPLTALLLLYRARLDLQASFPEVDRGDYVRLLDWARDSLSIKEDSGHTELARHIDWYRQNSLSDLLRAQNELTQMKANLAERESKLQSLEAEKAELKNESRRMEADLFSTRLELQSIKDSFGYYAQRFFASRLDRALPDGTKRGELRKIVVVGLRITRVEGIRSLLNQVWEKIQRREFRIVTAPPTSPESLSPLLADAAYRMWLKIAEPNNEDIERISRDINSMRYKPKISIVTPTYNTDPRWLKKCLDSVIGQLYTEWELCVIDDASSNEEVRSILAEYAAKEPRLKVKCLDRHSGIAASSNEALSLASADFVTFLDHDDELTPDALYEIVKLLNVNPKLDLVYTDEDHVDEKNVRLDPFYKPDWSPDLLMSYNYMPHLSVYRRSILQEIGGFRLGYDGSQDYDLVLRFTEKTAKIGHVPKVLYSWRKAIGSAAHSVQAKPYAYEAAAQVLREAAKRRGLDAEVEEILVGGRYRVRYSLNERPLVSILIPTKDARHIEACLASLARSTYDNYEILVLDSSKENEVERIATRFKDCRVLNYENSQPFNFSKINNSGAMMAQGEYLVFLNDDTQVITPEWIETMLEYAQQAGVGAVGAKLLYPNGTVQHAGVILGLRGPAAHYAGMQGDDPGYYDQAAVVRNCSAVTAACMMTKRQLFLEQGMFDETLGRSWQDVDFCLRLTKSGYRIVYTPFACLQHEHSATRGIPDRSPDEDAARELFSQRWRPQIERGDPFYKPNLSAAIIREANLAVNPMRLLFAVYLSRQDLQAKFPEAASGNFVALLRWAASWGAADDSAGKFLSRFADWYRTRLNESRKPPRRPALVEVGQRPAKLPQLVWRGTLTLLTSGQPVISVMLVTYNGLAHTQNCLLSLSRAAEMNPVPFEVIVIDNGSTDGSARFLDERVKGIQLIPNDTNRGFGSACNQAARVARGKYLLFLNNDAEIQPGAIQGLMETIERDPGIGAVGAKLIYPNGLLQEAGSIIWRDGTAQAFGRGDIPDKSRYCYVRDVDYCSATCLLVRRSLFEMVGGFDERYSPAYYEDTDLCMAIRSKGYKVVFQPEAEVVHHEYGASTSAAAIELMRRNHPKFQERWQAQLAEHPRRDPTDILSVLKAADRHLGRWILVIDQRIAGLEGSGFPRMDRILSLLKRLGHRITFIPMEYLGLEGMEPYARHLRQSGIEVFTGSRDEQSQLLKEIGPAIDFVIVSRPPVFDTYATEVRMRCPRAKLVFDSEALWFVRTLRQASLVEKARVSECIRDAVEEFRVELTAFIESDVIFAISDADREEILHLVPNAQVVVIPNIHDAPENVSPPDQRRDLLLAAGFIGGETSPNTDAANFFVKDIWPIIERELPGVRLHIVGANPPSSVTNLRSQKINVTGRITEDELAEYYETCKVAVIPLRFGAGLKNKTTEAMAYGLPLVTTSTGVESSKLIDGESAFVTDDPGTFAQRVVQLYRDQDMWSKFSRASREIAIHDFSADAVSSRLETIFQIHPNN